VLAYLIDDNWQAPTGPSCRTTATFGTTFIMLCRLLTIQAGISRTIIRRSFSSTTPEAFIQPLKSDPEIACLFLNKPQTKNAISRRMLQVKLVHAISGFLIILTLARNFKIVFIPPSSTKGIPHDHYPWSQLIVQTASVCLLCGRPAQMPSVLVPTWRSDAPCRKRMSTSSSPTCAPPSDSWKPYQCPPSLP